MGVISAQTSNESHAQRHVAAQVARAYYLEDRSKVEIASELGLSRFKVARLLEFARESGIVTIEVHDEGMVDAELSGRLRRHLGIAEAIVVSSHGSEDDRRRHVGGAAAELLSSSLHAGDVLGLAWGRTLTAMTEELADLPPVSVVQLTGAIGGDLDSSPVEVVRRVALRSGADARAIFAPLLVNDAHTADALRSQPQVARAMERFRDITVAVLSVGSWSPPNSQLLGLVSPDELRELTERGVTTDIAGILLDNEGRVIAPDYAARSIAISAAELARVPRVIAVASGASKARAVYAATASRLVSAVVVDRDLALAALELSGGSE